MLAFATCLRKSSGVIYEPDDAGCPISMRLSAAFSSSSLAAAAIATSRVFLRRFRATRAALARSYSLRYACQRVELKPSMMSLTCWRMKHVLTSERGSQTVSEASLAHYQPRSDSP